MNQLSGRTVPVLLKVCLPAALAVAFLLACGGDDDSAEGSLEQITREDLALMVLPPSELGEEFSHLTVDSDSGPQEREGFLYPVTTRSELVEAGWVDGYLLELNDPEILAPGPRVLTFQTSVMLFEEDELASAHLNEKVDGQAELEGEEVEDQVTLVSSSSFEVNGAGDETFGMRQVGAAGELEFYATVVALRVGPLLAFTAILRNDDADVTGELQDIADVFHERIRLVIAGGVDGTPVPIPTEPAEDVNVLPPVGGTNLAEFALAPEDLPDGVVVETEGYLEDDDTLSSFEREFEVPSGFRIGGSSVIGLEQDLDLYETGEAVGRVERLAEGLTGPQALGAFRQALRLPDLASESLQTRRVDVAEVGDESAVVHASIADTGFGSVDFIYIVLRDEALVSTVSITGAFGETLDPSDFQKFMETIAAKMGPDPSAASTDMPSCVPTPPQLESGHITDHAQVLEPNDTATIESALEDLLAESGIDLFVLFAQSAGDSTAVGLIRQIATNEGLGGDDALVAAFVCERRTELFLSAGLLEDISNVEQDAAIDMANESFAQGDYVGGIVALAEALSQATAN